MLTGLRPDKYLRMAVAARHEGVTNTVGIAVSARRGTTDGGHHVP